MPVDIIEMFWGCKACNGENKGRFKECQTCGRPREEDSPEWMPDDVSPMAAVKDLTLLTKFKGGEDWSCKFCGSSQFRVDMSCAQCGARQDGSMSEPAPPKEEPPLMEQPKTRRKVPPPPPPRLPIRVIGEREYSSDAIPMRRFPYHYPGIAIGVALLGVLFYFIFRSKVVEASVSSTAWHRGIVVERRIIIRDEGWNSPDDAFNLVDQGSRIHHYDKVVSGSHTEHYTDREACGQTCRTVKGSCRTTSRNCVSQKNGSARCTGGDRVCDPDRNECTTKYCNVSKTRTVTDYTDVPRYQTWYSWNAWRWRPNRTVTANGVDNPHWPGDIELGLNENCRDGETERLGSREETYTVNFLGVDSEKYPYNPPSEGEFSTFKVGGRYQVRVRLGSVVEVLPIK